MSSHESPAAITPARLGPAGPPQRRGLPEPQDRLSRSVRWLSQSTRDIRRWIVGLVLVAGVCCCVVLNATSDRAAAQDLKVHGQWLVSNDVQVYVGYESTKSGGYWVADGVRVGFPGVSGQVPLQGAGSLDPLDGDNWKEGWQAPTAATGYQPPLTVIVRRGPSGAFVTGMAKGDYDYRVNGTTVQAVAASIGTAALMLAVLSLPLNRARLRRNARRDAQRMARITTTGRRGTTGDPRPPGTADSLNSANLDHGIGSDPDAASRHAHEDADTDPTARAIAIGLLVAGRVLIVAAAAAVVICRLTRPVWITAPQDAGLPTHWITNTTFVLTFALALVLPTLVLPMGSWALVGRSASELTVRTVLGPRRVSLGSVRVSRLTLPGRGANTHLLILRDHRRRMVIVGRSTLGRHEPAGASDPEVALRAVIDTEAPLPSRRRRALRYALGWLVIGIWSVGALVVFGLLMAAAGVA